MSKQSMRQPFSRNTLVMGPGKNKGSKVKYPTELDTPVNLRKVRPSLLHTSTLTPPQRTPVTSLSFAALADPPALSTTCVPIVQRSSVEDGGGRDCRVEERGVTQVVNDHACWIRRTRTGGSLRGHLGRLPRRGKPVRYESAWGGWMHKTERDGPYAG